MDRDSWKVCWRRATPCDSDRKETHLAFAGVVLGILPALWLTRVLLSPTSVLAPDAVAHAVVAQALGSGRAGGGWIDTYNGGFPLGLHYQMPALLVAAALVRLGVHATTAIQAVGLFGSFAAPLAFAASARAVGARWFAAVAGALLLAWMQPFYAFIGGLAPHLSQGLVSQAFALPIVIIAFGLVISGRAPALVPATAALAVASHAQIALGAFVVGCAAVLPLGRKVIVRFVFASAGAGVFGAALYGPGLLHFGVPFGWANVPVWRILGHSPRWFWEFLSRGELLDSRGLPVMTTCGAVAFVVLVLSARRPASRAALAALVGATLGCAYGASVAAWGVVGKFATEVVSPVRLLVVLPLAIAVATTVAIHTIDSFVHSVWVRRAAASSALLVVGTAFPAHLRAVTARADLEREWHGAGNCGAQPVEGWDGTEVRAKIAELDRGRFVLDWKAFPDACAALLGVELSSRIPLGDNMGGPGSQVGVLNTAFAELRIAEAGSAARAEVLGARFVLTLLNGEPGPGFRTRYRRGQVALLEREGGTDLVGVGCVEAGLEGPDRAIRSEVVAQLTRPAADVSRPRELLALTTRPGRLEQVVIDGGGCDATDARVLEERPSGASLRAVVESRSPVDVVFRVTDFAGWSVTVDGAPVVKRRVAPGFFAVRIGAGRHQVAATVSPLGAYAPGLVLGAVAIVGLGIGCQRRARAQRTHAP